MQSAERYLGLPTYFLIGPGSWPAFLIMISAIMLNIAKRDTGWQHYLLIIVCPIAIQIIALYLMAYLYDGTKSTIAYAIIIFTMAISIYLIYLGIWHSSRRVGRVLVACCQV
jgi:hypothetical protein